MATWGGTVPFRNPFRVSVIELPVNPDQKMTIPETAYVTPSPEIAILSPDYRFTMSV